MSDVVKHVEEHLTEEYMNMSQEFGFNPTIMRVYMILFFSDKPLGLKEISEKTGYSVSTALNAMTIVEKMTDVRHFKKPKSKKTYYECQHNTLEIIRKKISQIQDRCVRVLMKTLKEAESELAKDESPKAQRYRGYIKKMIHDYECCDKVLSAALAMHNANNKEK